MMSANFLSRQFFGSLAVIFGLSVVLGVLPKGALAQPTPGTSPMKIGVIGSGNIGSAVGTLWVKAGHQVLFSSRHPENLKQLVDGLGPLARAGTVDEALSFGDVVFIGVPYGAYPQIAKDYGKQFAGKIVLDAGNAVLARDGEIGKQAAGKWRCAHLGEVVRRRAHRPRLQYLELSQGYQPLQSSRAATRHPHSGR